ncbi:MAG: hypothetical protein WCF85_10545 [Rhodospirillaceae bacterium]
MTALFAGQVERNFSIFALSLRLTFKPPSTGAQDAHGQNAADLVESLGDGQLFGGKVGGIRRFSHDPDNRNQANRAQTKKVSYFLSVCSVIDFLLTLLVDIRLLPIDYAKTGEHKVEASSQSGSNPWIRPNLQAPIRPSKTT